MSKLAKRLTALLLSGMLIIGSTSGSVLAASIDLDPSQTSEIAEEVYDEDTSEALAGEGEMAESEDASEAPTAAGESYSEEASYFEEASAEEAAQYYTVTLDANGGYFENEWDDAVGEIVEQAEVVTKQVPVGGSVAAVPVFSDQDGQTMLFAGWRLEPDGEVVSLAEEEYIPVENCVLYAVWQAADENAGVADTAKETVITEESGDSGTEESEFTQEYDDAEAVEETETGSEDTDDTETAQGSEETADEADTAQETADVDSVEYTAPEADNEQDATPFQEEFYSDDEHATSESSSDSTIAEEETNLEPSEEEETVKEEATNGVVASGTCGANGDNLTWTLDAEGKVTISGTGDMDNYGISADSKPTPWKEYRSQIIEFEVKEGVTSIGDYAFYASQSAVVGSNDCLLRVTIPNSIKSIGKWAYFGCSQLTNIEIPDNVNSIGDGAFKNCFGLTEITIPYGVTSIEKATFGSCSSLTNVIIPDSVTSIGPGAFQGCSSLASILIPNSVKSIGDYAFQYCNNLNSITIPNSVTSMGKAVFYICKGLEKVYILNGVTSIGDIVFYRCSNLKIVTIPNSVTSIGDDAFKYCNKELVYTPNEYVINYCKSYGVKCFPYIEETYPEPGAENVDHNSGHLLFVDFAHNIYPNDGYVHLYKVGNNTPVESIHLDESFSNGFSIQDKSLELYFSTNSLQKGTSYYITIDENALIFVDDNQVKLDLDFPGLEKNIWTFKTVDLDYFSFTNPTGNAVDDKLYYALSFSKADTSKLKKEEENGSNGLCFGLDYLIGLNKLNGNMIQKYLSVAGKSLSDLSIDDLKNTKPNDFEYSFWEYLQMAFIYQYDPKINEQAKDNKNKKDKLYEAIGNINDEPITIGIKAENSYHAIYPITKIKDNNDCCEVLVYDSKGKTITIGKHAGIQTFLNTLKFIKNNEKITSVEFDGKTCKYITYRVISTSFDNSIGVPRERWSHLISSLVELTANNITDKLAQIESTNGDDVVSSSDDSSSDTYLYWFAGSKLDLSFTKNNTVSISGDKDDIEVTANEGASVTLDIENKTSKVDNSNSSGHNYSIIYTSFDNNNTQSVVIAGEISSTVNTESTDNGIIVSNEDNTPIEAVISVLDNGQEVSTVNVTATTNMVNVTCDENNQIAVLEDKDSDGTYETVVATTDGKSIGNAEITGIVDKQYTGSAIEQIISVTYSGTELNEGTDYTVAYENNINAGTASVIISGVGDYIGTITKTFTIEKAAQQITVFDLSLTLPGTGTIPVSGNEGKLTYESDNTDVVEVDASGNLTAKGVGTANITITAEATDNYLEATKTITVTVYIPVYYTVTMDSNGGVIINETDDDTGTEVTNSEKVTKRVVEDSYVLIPARHVRNEDDSLLLYGWSISPDGEPVITFNEGYKPDGDCTLYAVWKLGTLAGTRLYGDFNDNGIIDSGDALRINRHISANNDASVRSKHPDWIVTGYDYEAADINHDAIISSADVDLVYQCVAAQNSEQTLAEHPDWILTETFDFYSFEDTQPKLVTGITLNNNEIELEIGKTATLTTDVIPADADDTSVKWSSNNTEVVTVDDNGNVTGVSAGTATITVAACDGSGVYATCEATVTAPVISVVSIAEATVTGISAKTYTGKAITQTPVVKIGDTILEKDTDYTVAYANNKNTGTATVTITGIGYYEGTITKTFTINPASIAKADVTGIKNKTYTGKALTQVPVVKLGSTTLNNNTDYKLTYKNNTYAGTATVTITGKGNYASKKTVTFKINKAAQSITTKAGASRVAVGKTTTVSITGNKGKKSYKSSNTAIATVTSAGKVTAKKVGTVKITATSAATANYKAASKTVTIKVVPAATASLTAANQVKGIKLTWKKVTGANGYIIYRNNKKVKTITSGATVTWADTAANTNGTKYTYNVVAKASTGDSTLSRSRVIYRVARPAVSSVTNSAASKMTVKWGKNAKANGYQIQYSTDKTFKSGVKSASITNASTVSKEIGSLTKGKTYYVRIRTYKTVGSAKYWSEWSPVKSVKISK